MAQMHRNQKASPFSLNCGVFFKPILYFPEGFEVNLQVDLSGGKKKCGYSKLRSEQENTIPVILDVFKFWCMCLASHVLSGACLLL